MRLLRCSDTGEFSLTQFHDEAILPYVILSHTWGADTEEITFEDLTNGTGKDKPGYEKIRFCGEQAALDNLEYFWIDTCCIRKTSDAELTEAINSMYRWYRDSVKCYVYLSDVSSIDEVTTSTAIERSRWFTRGWTLQELLAPSAVKFFTKEGGFLGSKESLRQQISDVTQIPAEALSGTPLKRFSVEERMKWAERRNTTRKEDAAYSLLGIFGVHMPLIYGEGDHAFDRLREKIMRKLQ
ncbi:HET-domain-containing protein [Corynespora cassiicola Philippines]|uniref:HET-domain-containing protein n=1 Tax=Corynespora cassiicola Philippines TaxID=1448308 RepID=A0A2T2NQ65_CORCC|nr:HET-domain-containing protein [Corynespora cassiicola Philippines]